MINYRENTIVAIATPLGVGGIGIVRLSGDKSLEIARHIFRVLPQDIKNNVMYLGHINAGEFTDRGYCVYFKAPKSFTGEDVVEFQVHGSPIVLQSVVNECVKYGAVLANRGEFSQRAFLNGKMSLDEAESLIDLINSVSVAEAKATENLLHGSLKNQIVNVQEKITDILAQIDVSFDYPEHDDETQIGVNIKASALEMEGELQKLADSYAHGRVLTNGVNICIVGKPNVGKSSLLNAMLGVDTAIVTDIAGTTTDIIKDTYLYNGIRFNLIDTAGIRKGANLIENKGIEKSKEQLEQADIILFVIDNSQELDDLDKDIWQLIKDKKYLVLLNKSDLNSQINNQIKSKIKNVELISTKNIQDIERIKKIIYDYTISNNVAENDIILVNSRHYNAVMEALDTIKNIINIIGNTSLDCVAVEFTHAWQILGQIVGNTDIEGIIDKIFSKFCLGK